MTFLQASAAAGDIEMCQMLKRYFDHIPNGQQGFANQLDELFPEGVDVHETEQQRNTFNFDAILAAILAASTADLDAALNKQDNGSALCCALEEFRRQFTEIAHSKKIFNPQHLLRAFEVYSALLGQCRHDDSDGDFKKRDLFWRQIIGYTQRFMPACYAQAFAQGLYYLVKVDQGDSWRPEAFKRDLKLRCHDFSYFPLPPNSRSGLGFDFAVELQRGARCGLWYSDGNGRCVALATLSKTFVEQKRSSFQNITQRVRVQSREQSSDECRCVVQ
jgi:hypothetical protein